MTTTQIPPLRLGDRLTIDEFEERYEAMPDLKKAELIEGEVFMPSPVSTFHSSPHGRISGWLSNYDTYTDGVEFHPDATVRLLPKNEFQPDASLLIHPEFGGRIFLTEKGYIEGPPELVVEISHSTVSIDVNKKLEVYQRHGINEYIVWRVDDGEIDWFVNKNKKFTRAKPDKAGVMKSTTFPGLWLDIPAMTTGNMQQVLATLNLGLASREHTRFVATLKKRETRNES